MICAKEMAYWRDAEDADDTHGIHIGAIGAASNCCAKIMALKNAAPQVGASGQPHTNAKTIGDSPAVAACSGPDFNQEVNLHADTIAERHDANWTCGCGHVNGCNLEWCAMCLRRPNGRHKDE